jgi:hypothetical protein
VSSSFNVVLLSSTNRSLTANSQAGVPRESEVGIDVRATIMLREIPSCIEEGVGGLALSTLTLYENLNFLSVVDFGRPLAFKHSSSSFEFSSNSIVDERFLK